MARNEHKPSVAFRIEKKDLLLALNLASSIIERRNLLSILSNIKLEVKEQHLTITATDQDISLVQNLKVDTEIAGSTTVDLQIFLNIVRKVPAQELKIYCDAETNQLLLVAQSCRFKLNTLPSDKFPAIIRVSNPQIKFSVQASKLAELIRCTQFAISTTETRYNLNGICFHASHQQSNLSAVALDGHRMALLSTIIDDLAHFQDFNVILPRKTAQELMKILQDSSVISQNITISLDHNLIQLTTDHLSFSSKLIDAKFPNYLAIIPQNFSAQVMIDIETFAQAVDRVSTVIIDKFRAIQLKLSPEALEIEAYGEGKGEASEVIKAEANASYRYAGPNITIGFNPKYLADIFSVAREGLLSMSFNENEGPVIFSANNIPAALFAIMPIKSSYA